MSSQSPEELAADYWNQHLEHNHLRAPVDGKGPDTDAGAFLAWMLEAAGDILRQSSNKYPDQSYMFEKWNRLKKNINERDWSNKVSFREATDLMEIQKMIDNLPATDDFTTKVKALMVAISIRAPSNVDAALERLKPLLQVAKPVAELPQNMPVLIDNEPQTYYDHIMNDFKLRPLQVKEHLEKFHHIKAHEAKKGYEREVWQSQHEFAHKNPDWEYRPDEIYEPEVLKRYPNDAVPEHIDEITQIPETPMPVLRGAEVRRTSPQYDDLTRHLGYESIDSTDLSLPTDVQLIEESQCRLSKVTVIPEYELTESQKTHLKLAKVISSDISPNIKGIHAASIPPASDRVRTAGLYGRSTREIFLAPEQLNHGQATVDTTIHELAHDTSGKEDGEEGHKLEMETISANVVKRVKNGKYDKAQKSAGFQW
jgi:hypothetical protein